MNTPVPTPNLSDVQAFIQQKLADLQANRQSNQDALDSAHAAEVTAAKNIAYDAGAADILTAIATQLAAGIAAQGQVGDQVGGTSTGGQTVAPGITQNPDGTFQNPSGQATDSQGNLI